MDLITTVQLARKLVKLGIRTKEGVEGIEAIFFNPDKHRAKFYFRKVYRTEIIAILRNAVLTGSVQRKNIYLLNEVQFMREYAKVIEERDIYLRPAGMGKHHEVRPGLDVIIFGEGKIVKEAYHFAMTPYQDIIDDIVNSTDEGSHDLLAATVHHFYGKVLFSYYKSKKPWLDLDYAL